MHKSSVLLVLVALAVLVSACSGSNPAGPSGPSGPAPTQPGFPPGAPVVTETASGQMGPDSPATCEPAPAVLDSRICDTITVTVQKGMAFQSSFSWSPAEDGAINGFVIFLNSAAPDGRDGGENSVLFSGQAAPSGTFDDTPGVWTSDSPYNVSVSVYLRPGGHGKSNYKLEVKHTK